MWVWPNLLSLDAVAVALLWQQLFALPVHVPVSFSERCALGLAVWIIYVVDRVVDSARPVLPTARHVFYSTYRKQAIAGAMLAAGAEAIICCRLPAGVREAGLLLLSFVLLYMLGVHLPSRAECRWFPKEAAVALLFAAGTALAAFSATRSLRLLLPFSLFTILCLLNCSRIEISERRHFAPVPEQFSGPAAWCASNLQLIGITVAVAAAVELRSAHSPLLLGGIAISALALIGLDRVHEHLSANQVRVLADIPLVLPLFLMLRFPFNGL